MKTINLGHVTCKVSADGADNITVNTFNLYRRASEELLEEVYSDLRKEIYLFDRTIRLFNLNTLEYTVINNASKDILQWVEDCLSTGNDILRVPVLYLDKIPFTIKAVRRNEDEDSLELLSIDCDDYDKKYVRGATYNEVFHYTLKEGGFIYCVLMRLPVTSPAPALHEYVKLVNCCVYTNEIVIELTCKAAAKLHADYDADPILASLSNKLPECKSQ